MDEEPADEPGAEEGLLELRCLIQIMTCHEDNEISFEIPSISKGSIQVSGFKLAQAPADESVFEVKKENALDVAESPYLKRVSFLTHIYPQLNSNS